MSKLRWELKTNNHKPWVSLFNHKYKNHLTPHSNSSFIFKSIFKDNNTFTNNTSHIVTNGKYINLWNGRWLRMSTLRQFLTGSLDIHDQNLPVSSIMSYSGNTPCWNLSTIPFIIPDHLSTLINNIPLPLTINNSSDSIFWNLTPHDNFTLKSAYNHNINISNSPKLT